MDEDEAPEMTDEETIRVCIEQVAMLEDDIRRRDELIAALRVGAEAIRDQGYRAGIEAAANEAWNVIAAHATDSIPLALADEVRDYIRALSQPREPTPSPAATLCGSEEDDEDSYRRRVASEDAHAPVCEVCNRPATSPVHATSLDGLIGPTHGFQAKREDAHAPTYTVGGADGVVRTWAERVADVEARAERALCPACAGLGVCQSCAGTGRDDGRRHAAWVEVGKEAARDATCSCACGLGVCAGCDGTGRA